MWGLILLSWWGTGSEVWSYDSASGELSLHELPAIDQPHYITSLPKDSYVFAITKSRGEYFVTFTSKGTVFVASQCKSGHYSVMQTPNGVREVFSRGRKEGFLAVQVDGSICYVDKMQGEVSPRKGAAEGWVQSKVWINEVVVCKNVTLLETYISDISVYSIAKSLKPSKLLSTSVKQALDVWLEDGELSVVSKDGTVKRTRGKSEVTRNLALGSDIAEAKFVNRDHVLGIQGADVSLWSIVAGKEIERNRVMEGAEWRGAQIDGYDQTLIGATKGLWHIAHRQFGSKWTIYPTKLGVQSVQMGFVSRGLR